MRGPSPIDTPPGWSLNAQLPFDYPVSRAILRTGFWVIYGTLTATQAGNGICTVRAGPSAGASAGDGQASATTRPAFCTAATSHPSAPVPGASAIAKCRGQPPPTGGPAGGAGGAAPGAAGGAGPPPGRGGPRPGGGPALRGARGGRPPRA